MEYKGVRLVGPNGAFSYRYDYSPEIPFAEFSALPLSDIQELCLDIDKCEPLVSFDPSYFPALKTVTLKCDTGASPMFSALLPDPSFFPSLKTLGLLDCAVTEEFMGELK